MAEHNLSSEEIDKLVAQHDQMVDELSRFVANLEAAYTTYAKDKDRGAIAALAAVATFMGEAGIEARLRQPIDKIWSDHIARLQGGGRIKDIMPSLVDAFTAAAVDLVSGAQGITLAKASEQVSTATGKRLTGNQVKHLRDNLQKGNGRREAVDLYRTHLASAADSEIPNEEIAEVALDHVREIWLVPPR